MMNESAQELNIPETCDWVYVPMSFIGERLGGRRKPQAVLLVESLFYSLSGNEPCRLSYAQICHRLGVCRDTVARSVKLLSARVTHTHGKVCSAYLHAETRRDLQGVEVPEFLLRQKFTLTERPNSAAPRTVTRCLKPMEAILLSEIRRAQRGGAAQYQTSMRSIAKRFCTNASTVCDYITALRTSGLLHRKQTGRGCTGEYLSEYVVDNKLLVRLKKTAKREEKRQARAENSKALSQEERAQAAREIAARNARIAGIDGRTERERWYVQRRAEAERKAERTNIRAERDEAYRAAQRAVRALSLKIATAEVLGGEDLPALRQQMAVCAAKRKERLAALHITEEELVPHYHCSRCHDTGFDVKTGVPCSCYDPPDPSK